MVFRINWDLERNLKRKREIFVMWEKKNKREEKKEGRKRKGGQKRMKERKRMEEKKKKEEQRRKKEQKRIETGKEVRKKVFHHSESVRGKLTRELIQDITSTSSGHKFQNGEYRKEPKEPEWICPIRFQVEHIAMERFSMEYLQAKKLTDERVILQLHGGGYIGPMKNRYRDFAVLYSKALGGGSVLTIDYRVAPENPFPAALEDAYEAYEWLLEQGYSDRQIFLAGDSAGGGLALALCHYRKDKKKSLPEGLILMSPWTDLTGSGESYLTNYHNDPLFGNTEDSMIKNLDYVGEYDPKNPYISPLFGEFDRFPPMLIQVGSYEMLLSDSEQVAKKVKAQHGKIRLSVYEGMFHVFQMAGSLLPESKEAWREIVQYLDVMRRK